MIYYHGTTNKKAEQIKTQGLNKNSYLTTSLDDAKFYAKTGGEWCLQDREEKFLEEYGYSARSHYYPDLEDMYKALYPANEYPVVLVFKFNENINGVPDSGAEGAIKNVDHIDSSLVIDLLIVFWE